MGDGIGDFAFWIAIGIGQVAFWAAMSPIIKALAQRISGKLSADQLHDIEERLALLEGRALTSGEVEAQFSRLAEVEERLDFTERVLASRAEPPHPLSEETH